MTSRPRSPRKIATPEEKKAKEKSYRVTIPQFGDLLEEIVQVFKLLTKVGDLLKSSGTGFSVAIPTGPKSEEYFIIGKKELRSARASFSARIRDLKNFFRVSKKKTRDPVEPESLKGVYTPVYAAEALRTFFTINPEGFGKLSPLVAATIPGSTESEDMINLMLTEYLNAFNAFQTADAQYNTLLLQLQARDPAAEISPEQEEEEEEIITRRREAKAAYKEKNNHEAAGAYGVLTANGDRAAYEAALRGPLATYLPQLSNGYLLRNTSTMAFYVYAHENKLQEGNVQNPDNSQFAHSDATMNTAFNGTIPAAYYSVRGSDGKLNKYLMEDAVRMNLLQAPINTYTAVKILYPRGTKNKAGKEASFDENEFNTYFFQNIAAANYFSKPALKKGIDIGAATAYLDTIPNLSATDREAYLTPLRARNTELTMAGENLEQKDTQDQILDEHYIVKSVSKEWARLLEPGREEKKEAKRATKPAATKTTRGRGQGRARTQGR